jgi:site-specific DNA-methyltransferase (adenine-specific)
MTRGARSAEAVRVERGIGWEMHLGDCLDVLPVLDQADAVITDPPYGIQDAPNLTPGRKGKRAGSVNDWHPPSHWDAEIDPQWCLAVSRAAPVTAWFGQWRKREAVQSAMPIDLRAEIVWAKNTQVGPPCPVAPRDERIWIFSAGGIVGRTFETSVWDEPIIPTWARREHRNEKPVALMRRLVEWLTETGSTVLDPFAGSGSTGVAALQSGRRFIGIEKDAGHFALACERLRAEESGSTLQAARAGQLPLLGGVK